MSNTPLDKNYWDSRYKKGEDQWDIGYVSTPLKEYIDQLEDKNISILIPGCGNAHEAAYLLQSGFTNITLIDISYVAAEAVKEKFSASAGKLKVIHGDFFTLQDKFQLILEQTFFCALDPSLRENYAEKMYDLLRQGGKLVGLLFNRTFDEGPPFSGNKEEYMNLFAPLFDVLVMEESYNSIPRRQDTELFIILRKGQ
ncbi:MAG: methyltransferase domain-containing protein [Chitinophagaceae bacterium]|nr:MAG: methyltransferase domain-containing protein [Chitinophagaceae bacterium]